ncbi:hypothetical protein DMN91_010058 [Ooceraea biroi]|uniref:Uncharacterized protein n=1 Tax=Ooceraea biroi TaxID=2015173 RepID=A0A3L8DBD7_OOCBI|nr:hypothetical protein DMN91_010058 [Ooceraea biroi]
MSIGAHVSSNQARYTNNLVQPIRRQGRIERNPRQSKTIPDGNEACAKEKKIVAS